MPMMVMMMHHDDDDGVDPQRSHDLMCFALGLSLASSSLLFSLNLLLAFSESSFIISWALFESMMSSQDDPRPSNNRSVAKTFDEL